MVAGSRIGPASASAAKTASISRVMAWRIGWSGVFGFDQSRRRES
jgi:hypothetical protein